jgi:hypothetical protein
MDVLAGRKTGGTITGARTGRMHDVWLWVSAPQVVAEMLARVEKAPY